MIRTFKIWKKKSWRIINDKFIIHVLSYTSWSRLRLTSPLSLSDSPSPSLSLTLSDETRQFQPLPNSMFTLSLPFSHFTPALTLLFCLYPWFISQFINRVHRIIHSLPRSKEVDTLTIHSRINWVIISSRVGREWNRRLRFLEMVVWKRVRFETEIHSLLFLIP